MRIWLVLTISVGVSLQLGAVRALALDDAPPPWAWGFTSPAPSLTVAPTIRPAPAPADNTTQLSIPGSKLQFTAAQVASRYAPADWFPEDHPVMPDIVAHGRESAQSPIYACSLCHMPNGYGRPENANVAGLSYEYIIQQLRDFRNGLRRTSDPRKTNTALMAEFAKEMTDEEMHAAAVYFSSIPAAPRVKVVESKTAPKTRTAGGVFFALEGANAGTESLGNRIIETPINARDFELTRNPRAGFIAYVPVGSLKKGEALVRKGAGKVTPCTVCHGQDLRGLGPVPRLAGLSPSYLTRQLYDMQHGNRVGAWSPLMTAILGKLSQDDLLVAAAYLASLTP